MIVQPMDALSDLGKLWESWGGIWGGENKDPIHFEFPGFHTAPAPRSQAEGKSSSIAEAADVILGIAPGIGEVELIAGLLKMGFPESHILDFLSSPVSYLSR